MGKPGKRATKSPINPLLTLAGLEAASKRRKLRPYEASRLKTARAFRKEQEAARYQRRVKYAVSRKLKPPPPTTQARRKVVKAERQAKRLRDKGKSEYQRQKEKLKRKHKLTSKRGKKYPQSTVYPIDFEFDGEDTSIDENQINAVFAIERFAHTDRKPRLIKAFCQVTFKDELKDKKTGETKLGREAWVSMPHPVLAIDPNGPGTIIDDIMALIARYAVETIDAIELVGQY